MSEKKYHFNGVEPNYEDLDEVKREAAKCAQANGRSYNVYRVIGHVTADGKFVDSLPAKR